MTYFQSGHSTLPHPHQQQKKNRGNEEEEWGWPGTNSSVCFQVDCDCDWSAPLTERVWRARALSAQWDQISHSLIRTQKCSPETVVLPPGPWRRFAGSHQFAPAGRAGLLGGVSGPGSRTPDGRGGGRPFPLDSSVWRFGIGAASLSHLQCALKIQTFFGRGNLKHFCKSREQ